MAFECGLSLEQLQTLSAALDARGKSLEEMPLGSVRKNGNKWQAILRYTGADGRQLSLTHQLDVPKTESRTAAAIALSNWRTQVIEDAGRARGFRGDADQTVSALMAAFNSDHEQTHSAGSTMSLRVMEACVNKFPIAQMRMTDVTAADVQQLVNRMNTNGNDGRPYTGSTTQGVLAYLHRIHQRTCKGKPSPFKDEALMRPKATDHAPRETASYGVVVLDPEQISRVNAMCDEMDAKSEHGFTSTAVAARLALNCGLRAGECAGLRWEDVDLVAGRVHVRHTVRRVQVRQEDGTLVWQDVEGAPKTDSSRNNIKLSRTMASYLSNVRDLTIKALEGTDCDLGKLTVCGHLDGDHRLQPRNAGELSRGVASACERRGITDPHGRRIGLHALRHTAGSIVCKHSGLATASRFLRHANVNVTARYYVDSNQREVDAAVDATEAAMNA